MKEDPYCCLILAWKWKDRSSSVEMSEASIYSFFYCCRSFLHRCIPSFWYEQLYTQRWDIFIEYTMYGFDGCTQPTLYFSFDSAANCDKKTNNAQMDIKNTYLTLCTLFPISTNPQQTEKMSHSEKEKRDALTNVQKNHFVNSQWHNII